MKRLILMRHAKSAWDDPALADHERPLNPRGRLAAVLMGAWLAELMDREAWRINAALVSTSLRTRQTWDRIAPFLVVGGAAALAPTWTPEIYEAESSALFAALRAAPEPAETVLMLGHNPGMEEFADRLARADGPRPGRFPTAATAIFAGAGRWAEVAPGGFQLVAMEQPKSLV